MLISEPQTGTPSTVMQVLKQRFARQLRSGLRADRQLSAQDAPESRIRQPRFYDFNVCTEGKRMEKLRYMHNNPVKRELVSAPEHWTWSSFRHYLCREPGLVRVNDCAVMELKVRPPGRISCATRPLQKAQRTGHPKPNSPKSNSPQANFSSPARCPRFAPVR
jgi:hypothetical protein